MVMVDAQTVRGARYGPTFHEAGGRGGRTIGTKRTLLVEILGLPVAARVDSARPHDVTAARELLRDRLPDLPRVRAIVGDRAYRGLTRLAARKHLALDIKAPPPGASGFVPLRPLVRIEHAFAQLGRWRRLSRCYEGSVASARTWLEVAAVGYLAWRASARPRSTPPRHPPRQPTCRASTGAPQGVCASWARLSGAGRSGSRAGLRRPRHPGGPSRWVDQGSGSAGSPGQPGRRTSRHPHLDEQGRPSPDPVASAGRWRDNASRTTGEAMDVTTRGPLAQTIATTATDIWNDSCAVDELEYAISFGAVGATANPTIVYDIWKRDPAGWRTRVRELAAEHPAWTEVDLAWAVVEQMSLRGARLLEPTFIRFGGRKGRLSIQTNPTFFRTPDRMLEHGVHLASLAPNVIVKFPATTSGIGVMEEATYRGVSVNCTVSFSVAQALAAGEAVEQGLRRRESEGLPTDQMGPVITVMVGRLEDWLRVQTERDDIVADPAALPWAGIAVFKRAYRIFRERGLRARPLAAAIRHHYHWSEFIGGDCIVTLPSVWQKRFNASGVEVRPRMDDPVDPAIVAELSARFPDFVRAYEPDGLAVEEFDSFPPTVRTLRQFVASYHELLHAVADALLPNPDAKA